jgi:hypothetical protein
MWADKLTLICILGSFQKSEKIVHLNFGFLSFRVVPRRARKTGGSRAGGGTEQPPLRQGNYALRSRVVITPFYLAPKVRKVRFEYSATAADHGLDGEHFPHLCQLAPAHPWASVGPLPGWVMPLEYGCLAIAAAMIALRRIAQPAAG